MLLTTDAILSGVYLFSAPFLRISAMMVVAPIFSAPGFNLRARVLLSVLIAALVAPSISLPANFELISLMGLVVAIQEIGVGLMIGFILQLAFGAIVFGAQAMSMTMGLGFCNGGRSAKWSAGASCRSALCDFGNLTVFSR